MLSLPQSCQGPLALQAAYIELAALCALPCLLDCSVGPCLCTTCTVLSMAPIADLAKAFQCCMPDVKPGLLRVCCQSAKLASAPSVVTCTICKTRTQLRGTKRQPHHAYTEFSATNGACSGYTVALLSSLKFCSWVQGD